MLIFGGLVGFSKKKLGGFAGLAAFEKLWFYNTNRNNMFENPLLYATQLAGGSLLKKLKCFEIMLHIFVLLRV